jgi:hypothetical protein
MQVEIVAKLSLHPPQPILGAIRKANLFCRLFPIETAADQIGEDEVGRVGAVRPGLAGEAEPQIEIGVKAGAGQVNPRDFVEEHPGVDDPLHSGIAAGPQFKDRSGVDLNQVGRRHQDDLERRRLEATTVEPANADRLWSGALFIEPERAKQAR